jgi:hypothetical protein
MFFSKDASLDIKDPRLNFMDWIANKVTSKWL